MKKIIIVNWILKIFIGLLIFAIPIDECLRYDLTTQEITLMYKESPFGNSTPYLILIWISLLITAIVNIHNGLTAFIKDGYFNLRSSKQFIISGYLLIIIGASAIIFSMLYITETPREQTLIDIIIDLLLLGIGIGLLAFADVIKKGNKIETENNLTI
jgi:hypothetical protein